MLIKPYFLKYVYTKCKKVWYYLLLTVRGNIKMETKNQSLFNLTNDELSKFFYHEQDKNGFGKMIKLKLKIQTLR